MSAARHVLAVDQGTTGTTALVLDADGEIRGRAYTEITQHYPQPGWVEHDPMELFSSAVQVAGAAVADAGLRPGEIAALGLTNQRETTLLWDRATGQPVAPAIVWQDRRSAALCRKLRADGVEELVRSRTGLLLDSYFSATKLRWLLDRDGALRARAARGELAFGTVDSWLVFRLTGGRVHSTDVTNASRTMLLDLEQVCWSEQLAQALDVPMEVLPEVGPSGRVVAETDRGAFHGVSVPIAGVLGDQQAALFAQACFEPGVVKNTYGTGSFALVNTATTPFTGQRSLVATVALGLAGEPTEYALEGSVFVAGSAVQWLRDELGLLAAAPDSESLAAGLAGNDDVYFVPALTGLGAPHWDPDARGLIVGLTRGTGRAQLARAALEAIAYQSLDVVTAMEEESGQTVSEVRADGVAANAWLMQFQADVLDIAVDVPTDVETTSLGSGLLAGLVVGLYADRGELQRRRRSAHRYEPAMDADVREGLVARWQHAVELARAWPAQP